MCISSKRLDDRLLVLLLILLNIAATMAIATFVTIHLFLEALTVQFETSWSFAVAAKSFLLCEYLLFLLINLRDYYYIPGTPVTPLRKRRWRIPNSMRNGKTFLELFLKRFAKRFRVDWILCLIFHLAPLGILAWSVVLYGRRNQSVVRTGTVQYFSEVWSSI